MLVWIARPHSTQQINAAWYVHTILHLSSIVCKLWTVGACSSLVCLGFHFVLNAILLLPLANYTLAPDCNTLSVLFREECMHMCPMRAGRWQWSMVHLLGIHLVTVREDCQVVASSLMTPMHNVVQEEVVSCLNHQNANHFNVSNHSWHHSVPQSWPQLLQGHFVWCVLSSTRAISCSAPIAIVLH